MVGENESWKMKLFLFVILLAFAIAVLVYALNIMDREGSFLKSCLWENSQVAIDSVDTKDQALNVLSKYANTTGLSYDDMPLDYKCTGEQFLFRNAKTGEKYYVCKDGWLIMNIPYNCTYNFDLNYIKDIPKAFMNTT
ncbi:MAG: hypothetical protein NT120_01975 [Candidatus Aenigmarchaeota archaeon]|nr:hypothetical protein [Candidatus Aenigmarchaeota archaeon]